MSSLQLLLLMSIFLVIEAETSPLKEERDAPLSSIDALAKSIEQALTHEYKMECLYSSCPNLAKTPAFCKTIGNGNTAELDAVSPVLIQCAADGACDVKKFVQPFKQTNILLPGEVDKSKCYFTSNPGKLILSGIKQTAKALEGNIFDIHVTGKLTLTDFNLQCSNLAPIQVQVIIKLEFTYRFNNGLEDGSNGKPLDISVNIAKENNQVFTKAFQVFKKIDQFSNSIYGALSKLLASLYTGFYMRKCDEQ